MEKKVNLRNLGKVMQLPRRGSVVVSEDVHGNVRVTGERRCLREMCTTVCRGMCRVNSGPIRIEENNGLGTMKCRPRTGHAPVCTYHAGWKYGRRG